MARWWKRSVVILLASLTPAAAALFGPGCGQHVNSTDEGAAAGAAGSTAGSGGAGGKPVVTVTHPDAPPLSGQSSCDVTVTTGIAVTQAVHVELCSAVDYPTNPPSGGNHWPQWVAYDTYDVPVPREQYVHNLEHGALVLLYKCDGACPDVTEALAAARDAVTGDPLCLQIAGGPTERVVITPDPLIDTPIAIAAWGATYTATCIDPPSLADFATKHYGHGTEATCAQGYPIACTDGGTNDGGADDGGKDAASDAGGGG